MAKIRAEAILRITQEKFNLKTLITKENLIRVEILSGRVETICKFRRFKKGFPLRSSSEEDSDDDPQNEAWMLRRTVKVVIQRTRHL